MLQKEGREGEVGEENPGGEENQKLFLYIYIYTIFDWFWFLQLQDANPLKPHLKKKKKQE